MVSPALLRHSAHGYNVAPTACAMAKTKRQQTRTRRHRAHNANLQCCVAAPTTVGKHACSLTPTCKPHAQSQQHRAAEHSSVRTGKRGAQTEMASIRKKLSAHIYRTRALSTRKTRSNGSTWANNTWHLPAQTAQKVQRQCQWPTITSAHKSKARQTQHVMIFRIRDATCFTIPVCAAQKV